MPLFPLCQRLHGMLDKQAMYGESISIPLPMRFQLRIL